MHTKHHDGVCFFPSKYREIQPERDFVGEFVAQAHKRDMKVVAYYSATPDDWSCQEHPDWSCIARDGSPIRLSWSPFPIGVPCINNPGYRSLFIGQCEEIQNNYNTDGFWLDIYWYGLYDSEWCFCFHCREKYAQDNGGMDLLEMWETDEVKLWWRDSFLDLFRDIKKISFMDGEERPIVYNLAGLGRALGYEAIDEQCSFLEANSMSPTASGNYGRLFGQRGKPFEVYYPFSVGVDCWTFRPMGLLLLEAAVVTAHGGTVLGGFDVKPSGYFSGHQMDQLGEVAEYIRAREEFLLDVEPIYDVGLLLPPPLEYKLMEEKGWSATLRRNQIPYGVLMAEIDDLNLYQLLIVDEDYPMDEDLSRRLEEYVSSGGNIIVVQNAAGVGNKIGDDFILSKLLGVRPKGKTGFESVYIGEIDKSITSDLGGDPVRVDGESWKLELTTAEALAYYVYPIARWSRERYLWGGPNPPVKDVSKDPAITLNRYGDGKAIYLGFPTGKFEDSKPNPSEENPHSHELIRLTVNLVSLTLEEPLLRSETPSGVEIVLNRQGEGHILHMINHYVERSSFHDRPSDLPKLSNVSVWVNEGRIGALKKIVRVPHNQEMKLERDGSWVHVEAQELGIQEIFVLEH